MKRRNELIIIFINVLIIVFILGTNMFGSTMDFLNQHIVFPEYLRSTFYDTGKIIPSTITIGGIENIYNIAYYGLLNPIILISYLLPFIKMIDYIIISNIVLLMLSDILFYRFIKEKFSRTTVLIATLLFLLSGPLIFQFHRHFMFVNYMPFLILALINIDKNKKVNLIIDIFLIIMTSFYYSIPSIIVIIIYYLYKEREKKQLVFILLTSILMSGVLIIPTLYSILETRGSGSLNIFSQLIPNLNLDNLLYGAYCPGLTSIVIVALIYLIQTKNKKNVFLIVSIFILSFIPLIISVLNGGLYSRPKILIPLLPLLVYIIGVFLDDLINDKVDIKKLLILIFFINLVVLIQYHVLVYYVDLFFTVLIIFIYSKTKIKYVLAPIVILNFILCIVVNKDETYITNELYYEVNKDSVVNTHYRVTNLDNNNYTVNMYNFTPNIYSSTINKYYSNLYHNVFKINNDTINNLELASTKNVLFNQYMGVRYIVSDDDLYYPYKKVYDNVYELKQALPIGYLTNKTINKEYYELLVYPYNLDILLNYVVDENSSNVVNSNIKKIDLEYTYELGKGVERKDNKLYVTDDSVIKIFTTGLEGKILFINIPNQVEQEDNISMTINNQMNILTKKDWLYPTKNNIFHFCIEGSNEIVVKLTKGIYNVGDIEMYTLDNKYIENINQDVEKFDIIEMNSEKIVGNISSDYDGYLVFSIPYDKGFKIKVNGEYKDFQLINDSFIGLYLEKGNYDIEVFYVPPYKNIGIISSLIGLILLVGRVVYEKNSIFSIGCITDCNNNIIHKCKKRQCKKTTKNK